MPSRVPPAPDSPDSSELLELGEQIAGSGLSLRQLARRSGVHHTQISRVLNGHRPASTETLVRLRLALDGGLSSGPDDVAGRHFRAVRRLLLEDPSLDVVAVREVLAAYEGGRRATRLRRGSTT